MDGGSCKTCSAVLTAAAAALLCFSVLADAEFARGQDKPLDPGLETVLPEVAAPSPVKDYVITASALLEGTLSGCAGEMCTIAGTTVPIAQTFFIGLGVEAPAPPQLTDYMQDQVVLQDGSVAPGRMVGISDDSVVTDRGSFAREDVAWLYLLPQQEQTAQPDGFGAPENHPPGGQEPIGEPPPEEDSASDSTPTPGDAPQQPQGELGALWSGTIEYEWSFSDDGATIRWAATIDDLKLREHIYPILAWDGQESRRIGTSIHLVVEDSTQSDTFSMVVEPCTQTGSGVGTLDGEEDSSGSVIWKKFGDLDTTASIGWNIPAGPGMYVLTIAPETGPTRDTYPTSGCEPGEQGYAGIVIANYPPPMQFVNEFDPVVRTLDSNGGRMSGSYSATMSDGQLRVSWNVCREGVSCAGPPDDAPEEETAEEDICPEPRNETALLNLTLDQQSLFMRRLQAKFDEYFRLADEARQYEDEFNHATTHCYLWTGAKMWATFVLSNFAPTSVTRYAPSPVPPAGGTLPPSKYTIEAGKEFANLLGLIEKVLDNDGSWTLPNTEFGGWFSSEDIWDGFTTAYGAVAPSSFEAQIEGLRSCGAPTMQDQMDGAIKFLRLMAEVEPLMRDVHETLNRLRDMDEEQLFDAWNDYRRACLDHAACAGLDPAICDNLPPR